MARLVRQTIQILEMIKFSHTLFALPFAIMGGALAVSRPGVVIHGIKPWAGILVCMIGARSAAMAFNRLADRHFDARNPRTATRHLPSGALSARSVTLFCLMASAVFVCGTAIFLPENPWPIRLSIPVLLWLGGYSLAKRFTSMAHVWLGLALGMAPAAAWVAFRGELSMPPVLLGLAVTCWVSGFDILYACQDYEFDQRAGLHSIPARFGIARSLNLASILHFLMILMLIGVGVQMPMGAIYFGGVGAVAILLLYEHSLVKPDDLSKVNQAFFQVNILISTGLLLMTIADLWLL